MLRMQGAKARQALGLCLNESGVMFLGFNTPEVGCLGTHIPPTRLC